MDQMYVCPQCGEESDIQGQCQSCGLPMTPSRNETDEDSGFGSSLDETPPNEGASGDEEEDVGYNPYEE